VWQKRRGWKKKKKGAFGSTKIRGVLKKKKIGKGVEGRSHQKTGGKLAGWAIRYEVEYKKKKGETLCRLEKKVKREH